MKEMILQFYEKYADYAYRVALVRTNNKADAEDLSQEVVLKIIKNQAILRELIEKDESQAKSYLAKAVVNMTIERYKKSSNRLKREKDFANNRMVAIEEESSIDGTFDENKHAVLKAIKDLPEKYQTIIMLKFYEGHSNTELSTILNLKEVSIRSLISRAIQKLKQRLVVTGIVLSAINITKTLEATELVSAPTGFKEKIIHNIHQNYSPVTESSFSMFSTKGILSLVLVGLVATVVYTNAQSNLIHEKTASMPLVTQVEKELYFLEFDALKTNSEKELIDLVQSKGFGLEQARISYEQKGIATLDTKISTDNNQGLLQPEAFNTQIQLPYKLTKNKNFEIYLEAFNYTNSQTSNIGTNIELYITNIDAKRILGNKHYSGRFTVVNNVLYLESSIFEGIFGFHIRDNSYNKEVVVSLTNVSLQKIVVKELNPKETEIFLKNNAAAVQRVANTPRKED